MIIHQQNIICFSTNEISQYGLWLCLWLCTLPMATQAQELLATPSLEQQFSTLEQSPEGTTQFKLIYNLLLSISDPEQSCESFKKIIRWTSDKEDLQVALATAYIGLGDLCYHDNFKQKRKAYQDAIRIVSNSSEPCYEYFFRARLLNIEFSEGQLSAEEVEERFQQLLADTSKNACTAFSFLVESEHADYHRQMNHIDKSLSYRLKALEDFRNHASLTSPLHIATLFDQVADIFYRSGNHKKALYYRNKVIEYGEKKQKVQNRLLVSTHNSIGLSLYRLGKYEEAVDAFQYAINMAENIQDSVWIGIPQGNIASVLIAQERYEETETYLDNYLKYGLQYKEHGIVVAAYVKKAIVEKLGDDMPLALFNLRQAEAYLQKHQDDIISSSAYPVYQDYQKRLYGNYAEVYEALGLYKKALDYQKQYQEVTDSLNQTFNLQKLAEVEGTYRYKVSEEENKNLRNEAQQRESDLAYQRWIIIITSVVALVSIIGGIYVLFYFRLRKKYINNLEYLNRLKNRLFSVISHDLRGYISSLKGFVYLFKNEDLQREDSEEIIDELSKSTEYTSNLIDNLLLWGKSQMKVRKLIVEPHSVEEIVAETIFEVGWFAQKKDIDITLHIPEPIKVSVDKNVFEIALRNLISNAIKFTDAKGKITIKAEKQKNTCLFSIIDTGVGISEEDLVKIRRGISTTQKGTEDEKGAGLGLILCIEAIKESGGDFHIESTLGEGTGVYFTLPLTNKKPKGAG
ncbi:MAG: ATP-binding protein [Thermonemataceae bacterium]